MVSGLFRIRSSLSQRHVDWGSVNLEKSANPLDATLVHMIIRYGSPAQQAGPTCKNMQKNKKPLPTHIVSGLLSLPLGTTIVCCAVLFCWRWSCVMECWGGLPAALIRGMQNEVVLTEFKARSVD